MTADPARMEQLAEDVRRSLESADLESYRELLDPLVIWGPPDDPNSGCNSREQVLAWYRRGRAKGTRAEVIETSVHGDKILVGLRVRSSTGGDTGDSVGRWQVLTVVGGRVKDIRGFDDRDEAVRRI